MIAEPLHVACAERDHLGDITSSMRLGVWWMLLLRDLVLHTADTASITLPDKVFDVSYTLNDCEAAPAVLCLKQVPLSHVLCLPP